MSVQRILAHQWPEIYQIQVQAYQSIEPEPVAILQDKWQKSPECCFVYKKDQQIKGYLLAHAWNRETPPKLSQRLPEDSHGEILFLHDLAIDSTAAGQGIGPQLIEKLVDVAESTGYQEIRLVSIQNSKSFWQKNGFSALSEPVCQSYGDSALLMRRKLTN
ncbi:hypothetical protein VST7929_03158 [Vibrio stylophorae]|uniref:N-acetyltransferase domain-containing protein n=1 Tax=Vibrio stylophorae TaxID=659351 RepID=A0ABN8DW29_9VIBR|nr:GNAT family N-acetyltransferase [Vibrio stylophorae]CAH0535646.1 hypothetical protein VST7929_03158 [Vibrio stylophorae]